MSQLLVIGAIDLPDTMVGAVLPTYPMNYLLINASKNCVTMILEVRLFSIVQKDYVSLDSEFLLFCMFISDSKVGSL